MTPKAALRTAVFLLLASFILLGPGYRQVLRGRCPLFRPWQMYRHIGLGYCDAVFTLRSAGKPERRLTIAQARGELGVPLAPRERFRPRDVAALAQHLRDRAGPGAEVRVTARAVGRRGWEPLCDDALPAELEQRAR